MTLKDLKKIKWTMSNVLKAGVVILVIILVLSIFSSLFLSSFNSARSKGSSIAMQGGVSAPSAPDAYYYDDHRYIRGEEGFGDVSMPWPGPGGVVGSDAEEFETTEYSAIIEVNNKDTVCAEVASLKKFSYVVFERANESDTGCSYTFKVTKDRTGEVLTFIEALDPKNLSETTYTIKRQIEYFISEEEILERKLESIDETLEKAVDAYDEVAVLATNTQNVEALAQIIDSKIKIIQRLTQERINIVSQLERLAKGKAEQLDKLAYTYFYIDVYENKFVDLEHIKDSWKRAIKESVRDINNTIQNITVHFVSFLFILLQYILYFFILLFVVKYLVKATKRIWKNQ